MSENLVDTWPDWKLDTLSLRERSIRRERGEMLPKPTQQAKQLSDALSELKRLREENERLKIMETAQNLDRVGLEDYIEYLKSENAALRKDRDRLDWSIKNRPELTRGSKSGIWRCYWSQSGKEEQVVEGSSARAAIDAARTKEKGGE